MRQSAFERGLRDIHGSGVRATEVPTFTHGLWTLSVWIPALFLIGLLCLVALASFGIAVLGLMAMWHTLIG